MYHEMPLPAVYMYLQDHDKTNLFDYRLTQSKFVQSSKPIISVIIVALPFFVQMVIYSHTHVMNQLEYVARSSL